MRTFARRCRFSAQRVQHGKIKAKPATHGTIKQPRRLRMPHGTIRMGTSGWSYTDWLGTVYPPGTPPVRFLETYAMQFTTVEIDSSFYATPRADVVRGWRERTPDDFVFAAKVPR